MLGISGSPSVNTDYNRDRYEKDEEKYNDDNDDFKDAEELRENDLLMIDDDKPKDETQTRQTSGWRNK